MAEGGANRAITLVRILDLPPVTRAPRPPLRLDLATLVAFCEARLPHLNGRPGNEEARLAAKTRRRFTL